MLALLSLFATIAWPRPSIHPHGDIAWPGRATRADLQEDTQYPRKHTLYLNFGGGRLTSPSFFAGEYDENSAEGVSLMVPHAYVDWPVFADDEQTAVAVAQAVAIDMADIGVRVVYLERPSKTLPYTMAMIGGSYTLLEADSASGYAAVIDCDAVNQRRVVYSFIDGGTAVEQANVISQEAGHAWGLDHIFGADHIMSYEGFSADRFFADECNELCEEACQGPGTIGCYDAHAEYCPSGQQNDMAELMHKFGGPEPDLEAPEVVFTAPLDGETIASGDDMSIRADITDDYGGFGWKMRIEHDGEIVYDRVDYERRGEWYLLAPEDGEWTLTIEAEDHADHVAQASITVHVGTRAADTSGGSSSSSTSSTSEASGGLESTGDGSSDSTAPAAQGDDGGCSCDAGRSPAALPFAALLVWCTRRRRAC